MYIYILEGVVRQHFLIELNRSQHNFFGTHLQTLKKQKIIKNQEDICTEIRNLRTLYGEDSFTDDGDNAIKSSFALSTYQDIFKITNNNTTDFNKERVDCIRDDNINQLKTQNDKLKTYVASGDNIEYQRVTEAVNSYKKHDLNVNQIIYQRSLIYL